MDTDSLKLFVRIAELGAVSSAARDQSLSPASASARLQRLEAKLGVRLFNRTTRTVSLTPQGRDFLPYARQALETLQSGQEAAIGQTSEAKGLLRMSLPGAFGRLYVLPAMGDFQARHPGVQLDLRLRMEGDEASEESCDLVIRHAPLSESRLVARRLAADCRRLVAAPAYLDRVDAPSTPEGLVRHACLGLADRREWAFEDRKAVTIPGRRAVNDLEALQTLLVQGLGIGILPDWMAHHDLREGRLVEVLAEHPLHNESAIWALYPGGRIIPPGVRAMVDFLLDRFQPNPPWDTAR